jgi:Xaa-Pro dipeptidase
MRRRGFDMAVVWGRAAGSHDHCGDVLYLSNFYATSSGLDTPYYQARSFAAVILQEGETPELHTDEPSPRMDIIATDRVEWHVDPIKGVADALNQRGVTGRVAFVGSNFMPIKYWRQLEAYCPDITWVFEDDLVQVVRRVKSERELDCYRTAGEIVTRALNRLMEGLVLGKPETEAAGEASREIVRGEGRTQLIACSHGDSIGYMCRNPLTGYSHEAPASGDLVRGWIYGPIFQGYYLDPGRTAVACKRPSAEQRTMIEASVGIVDQLIDAIRPGMEALELAALGDRLTDAFGGDSDPISETYPLYGHGVGLFFEEPRIGTKLAPPGFAFEAGMVLGVEVFLSRNGIGSAAFEQNILVREDGNELLTTSPTFWW